MSKSLSVTARYDVAGNGRRMRGWNPPASGPNQAIAGLQKIRDRSRDATRNDWSGEAGIQKWTTNLIGVGIVPRVKGRLGKARKARIVDLWDSWVRDADADGVLNFYGMQTLAVRSWLDAGEVFVRLRPRRPESGLDVPFQVQLIEAEFVPLLDSDAWPGMPVGNRIRSGIELNKYGRRTAYWMYREHPADNFTSAVNAHDLIRIDAQFVRHVYEPKRPGQLRGVSALSAILARLRNVVDYDDAVLERQKLANLFAAFITRPESDLDDLETDSMTGQTISRGADDVPMVSLQPGMTQELLPGEDIKFANPPEAGTMYSEYMRTQNMGTAAGAGIPYELFSGDIVNVSDRTLRILVNEFRRYAEQRQWQIIIPQFCAPIRDAWAESAVIGGALPLVDLDAAKSVEWAPHGWQYIHPVQDVQGKKLEVESGFRSRSSVIGERGDDAEATDDERQQDLQREKALGLHVEPPAPVAAPATKKPKKKEPPTALETAQITMLNAQAHAALREPAASVINVAAPVVNVPPSVTNVASPSITVEQPAITVESPTVNVAAPAITVEQPSITVEQPSITVENNVPAAEVNVHLPTRRIESDVKRDSSGNIVHVTQTESTVDEVPADSA